MCLQSGCNSNNIVLLRNEILNNLSWKEPAATAVKKNWNPFRYSGCIRKSKWLDFTCKNAHCKERKLKSWLVFCVFPRSSLLLLLFRFYFVVICTVKDLKYLNSKCPWKAAIDFVLASFFFSVLKLYIEIKFAFFDKGKNTDWIS